MEINVNDLLVKLATRIGELEVQVAVLQTQIEELQKKAQEAKVEEGKKRQQT